MKSKYNIGNVFEYKNYNNTIKEEVEIVSKNGNNFVFESKFTPFMTICETKINDMINKGKLKQIK